MPTRNPFYAPELAAALLGGIRSGTPMDQAERAKAVLECVFTLAGTDQDLDRRIAKLESDVGIGRGDGPRLHRMIRIQGALAFAKSRGLDVYAPGKGPGGRPLLEAKRRPAAKPAARPKRRSAKAP